MAEDMALLDDLFDDFEPLQNKGTLSILSVSLTIVYYSHHALSLPMVILLVLLAYRERSG